MAEETKDEDLKLSEQSDGSVVVGDNDNDDDDTHVEASNNSSDEQSDDGDNDDHPDDSEERRQKNRASRAEAKRRRNEYINSLKLELASRDRVINDLSQRMSTVERKSTGSDMAQLETAEKEAVAAYNQFKDINARAIEQANGEIAIDAQERMFAARQKFEQIQNIKKALVQRQNAPQPLDPRMLSHAERWVKDNPWYDSNGKDEDSALVLSIDNRLAASGYDPTTPEYWDELRNRVKKYLPHRGNLGNNKQHDSGRRSAPPVSGSGRDSSTNSQSNYTLSKDRVAALKDAGLWDDPKTRAEAVKRYIAYDKEQRA